MSANFVTCKCQYCNKGIEFDANNMEATGSSGGGMTGQTVACPHCGMETILFVPGDRLPSSGSKVAAPRPGNFQTCPTCASQISATANACPKCGHAFKTPGTINLKDPVHVVGLLVCAVIIILVVLHVLNMTVGL